MVQKVQKMAPDLESLARARFDSPLTKAEIELVQRSSRGEFAVCGPNMDDQHPVRQAIGLKIATSAQP
jgi:hypothetical protein